MRGKWEKKRGGNAAEIRGKCGGAFLFRMVKMDGPTATISWMGWGLCVVGAYLGGSISFAYLIGKIHGVDLRTVGSKNVGATNCGRTLGRKWGTLCFVLDVAKGFLPVLVAGWLMGLLGVRAMTETAAWAWIAVAAAAILGHVFPVWLKFRGGKGVATGLGVLLGFYPMLFWPGLVSVVTWLVVVKTTRYVGLASVLAAGLLPVYFWGWTWWTSGHAAGVIDSGLWPMLLVVSVLAMLVVGRHAGNMRRLLAGTEAKVGRGKVESGA